MQIATLFKNLGPYVKPYRKLVIGTLLLTLVGSLTAQINAWILRYTVDELTLLVPEPNALELGLKLLLFISLVLIGKEILNAFITFGQKY